MSIPMQADAARRQTTPVWSSPLQPRLHRLLGFDLRCMPPLPNSYCRKFPAIGTAITCSNSSKRHLQLQSGCGHKARLGVQSRPMRACKSMPEKRRETSRGRHSQQAPFCRSWQRFKGQDSLLLVRSPTQGQISTTAHRL